MKDKLGIICEASIHDKLSSAEALYCAWIIYLDYLYLDSLHYLLYLEIKDLVLLSNYSFS